MGIGWLGRLRSAPQDERRVTYVGDDGRDAAVLTSGGAWADGVAVASALARAGIGRGDRVLLIYAPGLDFVRALLGVMLRGAVPVPVASPNPFKLDAELPPLARIAEDARVRVILCDSTYAALQGLAAGRLPDRPWLVTSGVAGGDEADVFLGHEPGDVAFLQYTSGSTSAPKGVRITFANLDHQLTVNREVLGLGADARLVMWVPHYHDFGLISGILSSLYGNGPLWMMSPLAFVQRPTIWFDVISRVRGTHTAAPNFAYELVARKATPAHLAAWDLSCLRVVMSAAEPVRPDTVRALAATLRGSGCDPAAFCPAYGLAEHTVGVTIGGRATVRVDRAALQARRVVRGDGVELAGCGRPVPGAEVRIVDPELRRVCADDEVGEVWVRSASVADGYDGRPEATADVFGGRLVDEPGVWLRTGDLGFFMDGELVICGRLKDLILVRGRNVYPEDVEETIRAAHAQIRPGGVAAFACTGEADTGEHLGVLVEAKDRLDAVAAEAVAGAVRAAVARDHALDVPLVIIARAGAVPKTSSGKVRRGEAAARYAAGAIVDVLHVSRRVPPRSVDDVVGVMNDAFRALVGRVGAFFTDATRRRAGRTFHKEASTGLGWLEATPDADLPAHPLFTPGRRFPVLVRHANGVQDDDAAIDNRGATVRILERADDPTSVVLDLLLTTGRCFLAPTASAFAAWMAAGPEARAAIVAREPHRGEAAWEMFRAPTSFAAVHYHSKTASAWISPDGGTSLVRFRLRAPDQDADTGFVTPTSPVPPEAIPRQPDDPRSKTFLHDAWRARLVGGGVDYVLEAQVRPSTAEALDPTRPWDAPWRRVAVLHLDRLADPSAIEGLSFTSLNAPADLAPPLAASPEDPASLEPLRQVVYAMAAAARTGKGLPASVREIAARPPARKALRVAVIGAGASGLSAAWHARAQGHAVTVFEKARHVAGKCASIQVDGRVYDLGGHLCTPRYKSFARIVRAVGAEIVPTTPTFPWDGATREVVPWAEGPAVRDAFFRYRALREGPLTGLDAPGNAAVAPAVAAPIRSWLATHGLGALGDAIGDSYTSTGYGYLDDERIPALYFLRAAETAGLLAKDGAADLPTYWTVGGGLQGLWERVAAGLDVRLGVTVQAVERRDGRVTMLVDGQRHEFDRLVVAIPFDDALGFLDATLDERALFGQIRVLDYYTIVARAGGLPTGGFYIPRENTRGSGRTGHTVAFHARYPDSDVVLFYAYGGEGIGADEVERRVRADVAGFGGWMGETLLRRKWKYFPHVGPDAVEAGYFAQVEALQGRNGTLWCGSLLGFELIENNVAYAEALVGTHLGDGVAAPTKATATRAPVAERQIAAWLSDAVAAATHRPRVALADDVALDGLGLDSLAMTSLVTDLSDRLGWPVTTTMLYEARQVGRIVTDLTRRDAVAVGASPPAPVVVAPAALAAPPAARPTTDVAAVRAYWRDRFGVGAWPFDDILFGFIDRFVADVVFDDPEAFARIRDRGSLYLANHQVATEPALLSTLMSGISGKPLVGLAKIEGRDSVLGFFMEHMFAYPGIDVPKTWTYLDRSNPAQLAERLAELSGHLAQGTRNVLVHVEGTRSVRCREPVKLMNPMLVEMALASGAPIVPVRLAYGLPVAPLTEKLDVPFGFTRQTYYVGRPIIAEELSPLGFSARSERVLAALNAVGPARDLEEPGPPDPAFAGRVERRRAQGFDPFWSIVIEVLAERPDPSPMTRRLLDGLARGELVVGDDPRERWLGAFARALYGDVVPVVTAAHSYTTA